MKFSKIEKRQLFIYIFITFGITYLMGILMWYGYRTDRILNIFPVAQMLYPATGVMVLLIVTKDRKELPMRFFFSYLGMTGMIIAIAISSVFVTAEVQSKLYEVSQEIVILGSIVCGIFLLIEKTEKKNLFGLKGKNGRLSVVCIVLFLLLYVLREGLLCIAAGNWKGLRRMGTLWTEPYTWNMLFMITLNFFLTYIAFLGEEYGWRYYLQPTLQKRYGKRIGVIILGVLWGIWHLPIILFYYSSPDMGLETLAAQNATCITLGIFFAYAYMKTENIWVPIILHFMNNNMTIIFEGNSQIGWKDIILYFIICMLVFGGFIFAKEYRKEKNNEVGVVGE